MPTVFTHSLIGFTASVVYGPALAAGARRRLILLSMFLAVAPDLDGIPYLLGLTVKGHLLAHRGVSHSLAAAMLLGALAATWMTRVAPIVCRRWVGCWLYFTIVTASHGLLDMATNGGSGIALFAPFVNHRMFWPMRPISVSPIRPASLFTPFGFRAIASELLTLWTLCGALLLATRVPGGATVGPSGRPVPLHWLTSAALVAVGLMAWLVFAS